MKNFIFKYGDGFFMQLCSINNDLTFHCIDREKLLISSVINSDVNIELPVGKENVFAAIPVNADNSLFYFGGNVYALPKGEKVFKVESKAPIDGADFGFFSKNYLYTAAHAYPSEKLIKKDLSTLEEVIIEGGPELYSNDNFYITVADNIVNCFVQDTDKLCWNYELKWEFVTAGWILKVITDEYFILSGHSSCELLILSMCNGHAIVHKHYSELLDKKIIESLGTPVVHKGQLYISGFYRNGGTDMGRFLAKLSILDKKVSFYKGEVKLLSSFFVNKHGVFVATENEEPLVLDHNLEKVIYDPKLRGSCTYVRGNDDFVLYYAPSDAALVIDCR